MFLSLETQIFAFCFVKSNGYATLMDRSKLSSLTILYGYENVSLKYEWFLTFYLVLGKQVKKYQSIYMWGMGWHG